MTTTTTVATGVDPAVVAAARRIADEVAAPHADDVDRTARFPAEAVEALREEHLLGMFVPVELGGGGATLETVAEVCFELGRRCAATAMVFAMHQIQVASMVRHLDDAPFFTDYLRRLAAEQRLIASATSEVGTGGDMGRSVAAVVREDDGSCTFEKQGPTVSYGAHADDLLVTLRRGPDAEPNDQVMALVHAEQVELEQTGSWDPLGMRGTCSPGFIIRARFAEEQVFPGSFARVAQETMVPLSHIWWSHVWLGIATDAFDRARAFVRVAARRAPGQPVAAALRLSRLSAKLSPLRAEVRGALRDYVAGQDALSTVASALRFNNLKLASSEMAPVVCQEAMAVCGIVGYKNDTPFSVGRHLRDAMSACLMIANERIHETDADLLLIAKDV
jgi:acyl-CoA dehydrogenase